jgi:Amt family ammonium transporter
MAEWIWRGKPSVLGFCSGVVAGLVVITPAAGFVSMNSAVLIGILAGLIPFFAVLKLKAWLGFDDALDTFGIHAVGGTLGAVMTGFLAAPEVNSNLTGSNSYAAANGLNNLIMNGGLIFEQLKAILITLLLSIIATTVIAFLIKAIIGLRLKEEDELIGLDVTEHGEEAYHTVQR